MSALCCPSAKPYRDRPNQAHEAKFDSFFHAFPMQTRSNVQNFNCADSFVMKLSETQGANELSKPPNRYFYCYYGEQESQPPPQAEHSRPAPKPIPRPTIEPSRAQPYRPPIGSASPTETKKSLAYGSGWNQQRLVGSPSSSSFPQPRGGYLSGIKRGPPTWVTPDAAESNNWRSTARPPSSLSTSTSATTSYTSPRSPNRTQGSFSFSRGDFFKRSPTTPKSPPSVVSASDYTSGWETNSNATTSTFQNRYSALRGDDDEVSDTSEIPGSDLEKIVDDVVGEDDDLPSSGLVSISIRTKGQFKVVEVGELEYKSILPRLIRGPSKMFQCPRHGKMFELQVYVSDE